MKRVDRKRLDPKGNTYVRTYRGLTIQKSIDIIGGAQSHRGIKSVTVHVGTNDLSSGSSDDEICTGIGLVLDKLKDVFVSADIFISGLLPQKGILLERVTLLNEALRGVCRDRGATLIWDRHSFLAKDHFPSHLFSSDKLHLNEKGIGILLRGIKAAISGPVKMHGSLEDINGCPREKKANQPHQQEFPPLHVANPQGDRQSVLSKLSSRSEREEYADHQRREQQLIKAPAVQRSRQAHSPLRDHAPSPDQTAERWRRGVTRESLPPPDSAATQHLQQQNSATVASSLGPKDNQGGRSTGTAGTPTVGINEGSGADNTLHVNYGLPFHPFSRQAFLPTPIRNALPFYQPFNQFQWPYQGPFPSPYMSAQPFSFQGHPFMIR